MKNSPDPTPPSQDDTLPLDNPDSVPHAPEPHYVVVYYVLSAIESAFSALCSPPPPKAKLHKSSSKESPPSPGIYAVTNLPVLSFTLAILRSPLFGFLGFVVPTRRQTPFRWGRLARAGDSACRARALVRGWRRTCIKVVERGVVEESGRVWILDWRKSRRGVVREGRVEKEAEAEAEEAAATRGKREWRQRKGIWNAILKGIRNREERGRNN